METFALFTILTVSAFVYMSLWYVFATYLKRIDAVDSAWGLGFIYVAGLAYYFQSDATWVQALAAGLVTFWGLRLFTHITLRNSKRPEDARYVQYRKKWGEHFLVKAYTNIYLLQGALILLVSTPIIAIMTHGDQKANIVTIIGFAVWVFGILFESVADYQLRRFLKTRKKGEIMQSGLWKHSRHPNYFGEITGWWGAAIVALSLGGWWGILGAAVITYLIVNVSGLPPLERRYAPDKAYQEYKKHTPALIPIKR